MELRVLSEEGVLPVEINLEDLRTPFGDPSEDRWGKYPDEAPLVEVVLHPRDEGIFNLEYRGGFGPPQIDGTPCEFRVRARIGHPSWVERERDRGSANHLDCIGNDLKAIPRRL